MGTVIILVWRVAANAAKSHGRVVLYTKNYQKYQVYKKISVPSGRSGGFCGPVPSERCIQRKVFDGRRARVLLDSSENRDSVGYCTFYALAIKFIFTCARKGTKGHTQAEGTQPWEWRMKNDPHHSSTIKQANARVMDRFLSPYRWHLTF